MTRAEAKATLEGYQDGCSYTDEQLSDAIDTAIKVLEQESLLDKLRAEIEALLKTYPFINHIDTYVKEDDVKKIIDKYKIEVDCIVAKAEGEDKE